MSQAVQPAPLAVKAAPPTDQKGVMQSILTVLAPSVPGTLASRRRFSHYLRQRVRRQIGRFDGLSGIDPQTKARMRRPVWRHSIRMAIDSARSQMLGHWMKPFIVLFLVVGWLGTGLLTWVLLSPRHDVGSPWLAIAEGIPLFFVGATAGVLCMLLLVLVTWVVGWIFPRSEGGVLLIGFGALPAIFWWIVYQLVMTPEGQSPEPGLFRETAIFLGAALYVSWIWAWMATFGALRWEERRNRRHHPDAVLVEELLNILHQTERQGRRWADLENRQSLLASLEAAATAVERDLPVVFRSRDAVTEHWWTDRTAKMAAAIRGLKRWVLSPMADTREQFASQA